MGKKKKTGEQIITISQFTFSILSPLFLCIALSLWLMDKFSLDYWVVLIGILLGIATMIFQFYKFCLQQIKKVSDGEESSRFQSNKHQ